MTEKTEFEKTMEMFNEMLKQLPKDQLISDQKLKEFQKAFEATDNEAEKIKILEDFKKANN